MMGLSRTPWKRETCTRKVNGGTSPDGQGDRMSVEDLEKYEAEMELKLYKEYRDVLPMFRFVVETERRFYLANEVEKNARNEDGPTYFELQLHDAWVWDMHRPAR